MPWLTLLEVLKKVAPRLAKVLATVGPFILNDEIRNTLGTFLKSLAGRSPTKRLRAEIEVTEALASRLATDAASEGDRELREDWARRARNLAVRVDLHLADRRDKKSHRNAVRSDLYALQSEMNDHLKK